jgi:hypothetical protein
VIPKTVAQAAPAVPACHPDIYDLIKIVDDVDTGLGRNADPVRVPKADAFGEAGE